MDKGYTVVDMDTHVGPNMDVLERYMDPSFKPRVKELAPYERVIESYGGRRVVYAVGNVPFDRFPGTAPNPEDTMPVHGGRGGNEGRSHATYRVTPQQDVQHGNSQGRLEDMDLEGRDIDFIYPGDWVGALNALEDPTLAEGHYKAYHRFMQEYTSANSDRLKGALQVTARDVEWTVSELKTWGNEKWVSAVWVQLPEGTPVDHPDLEPIWATMNDLDLPLVHHSFYMMPPYFPGYQDIWGNAVVARTFAHPWGAQRLYAYVILSGMLDRYPNFRVACSEVGHGWLPNILKRLDFNKSYLTGITPDLEHTAVEYAQMGRVMVAAEPFEGPEMTKACIDILGEECLMFQSDYPHGQCWFPDTVNTVVGWPIWKELGDSAFKKFMGENALRFLRII